MTLKTESAPNTNTGKPPSGKFDDKKFAGLLTDLPIGKLNNRDSMRYFGGTSPFSTNAQIVLGAFVNKSLETNVRLSETYADVSEGAHNYLVTFARTEGTEVTTQFVIRDAHPNRLYLAPETVDFVKKRLKERGNHDISKL